MRSLDPRRTDRTTAPAGHPVSRSAFLKGAAGTMLGVGLAAGSTTGASAATTSATPAAIRARSGGPSPRALEVNRLGPITGPGMTDGFGANATDLGIPVRTPDGRLLFVFGDTFSGDKALEGEWKSPVGLYSTTALPEKVAWSGAVGGEQAKQLWDYEHDNPEFSTVLPSDVLVIGESIYLHVSVQKGLGNVRWTEIWKSDDNGENWEHTGAKFEDPNVYDGMFQLWTWELHDDGYVYVFSTKFDRTKPMILHRVPAEKIADPGAYEPWGWDEADGWAWGKPPSVVLPDGGFGEMCVRRIEGRWLLVWFNDAKRPREIEGILFDEPTADLAAAHRRTILLEGSWGEEDDTHVAQLYGGYVIPGSTIDDLHLSVSQWNTETNWPYHVMHFRVRGFAS